MALHRYIDQICLGAALVSLVLTACLMGGEALGIRPASRAMGYETGLFDTSRVHTIELVVDDWEDFLETCENEEYTVCDAVIDGEACRNAGLRAKGNTSLSTVASLGSDRYSLKLEFDHYDSGRTFQGLDKLCLNNLIQDNTYMKDYLTYRLMAEFGAAAPLCSFARITVNGEDWGLYLAVEGVEDSFLQRNYGTEHGVLYKPDSMNFGGGRGNGRDFRMEDMDFGDLPDPPEGMPRDGERPAMPEGMFQNGERPAMPEGMPQDGEQSAMPEGMFQNGEQPAVPEGTPQDGERPAMPEGTPQDGERPARPEGMPQDGERPAMPEGFPMGGGPGGGMGSDDVKLKYTDDDPGSYANIFDSAKTELTEADQDRLIRALKQLGEGDPEALDLDAQLRYLVVHNFVVNGDSYTGSMVHNYYLYEEDGRLSMIPWDYNLAFGTFQSAGASQAVNDPIDTPLSCTGDGDRPMMDWILSSQAYTALYHQYFAEFVETADPLAVIDEAYALIRESVEWDPTKFCTGEEFEAGVQALREFCRLRRESVLGQLAGTVPSTREGQTADSAALTDASGLTLSDMGTMGMGGGGFPGRGGGKAEGGGRPSQEKAPGAPGLPPEGPGGQASGGGARNGEQALVCLISAVILLGGLFAARRWKHYN